MKKKIFSIFLAGTMVASVASMSAISASADDGEGLALGDYGKLGNYTPSSGVKTEAFSVKNVQLHTGGDA